MFESAAHNNDYHSYLFLYVTDAIAAELPGDVNKETRKHIRSALDLAVKLQHKRTAAFRDAAMCVEATTAVVNIVAIVSGRRDPQ